MADAVDEQGDGGGFASAGDSRDEYEAVLSVDDVFVDIVRETDVFDSRDVGGQGPDCGADAVVFMEDVDSKVSSVEPVRAVNAV